jgi:class 3 adenylate cyclase
MAKTRTVAGKYLFLDIICFSRNRTVEAQTDIVNVMNETVRDSLKEHKIQTKHRILIPTGDGICIALLNIDDPYDIHLQLALTILEKIYQYNHATEDEMRQLQIRIGINENTDNLIVDVNGNDNVAGAGITEAQRIMDRGDENTILLGRTVYAKLKQREKYVGKFRGYVTLIKHRQKLEMYQLINPGVVFLNSDIPESLQDLVGKIKKESSKMKKWLKL